MHKTRESRGLLGRLLGPLLNTGLALVKNIPKPLDKSVLIQLGLTASASAINAAINKKMFGSGACPLDLGLSKENHINNFEWRDEWYIKIVKSFEESGSLIKGVNKNETKEQKGIFFGTL